MFDLTTSEATDSAISSPVWESGPTRSGVPVGATIDLFGQVPVRANLSARQAQDLGFLTSGTYGRTSTGSSASAALQSSLESRLRARTQTLGSTLYAMTWKPWATPSGRSRFRLRASVRRTSETGSICGATAESIGQTLAVDHDHETGAVRGLLCAMCNRMLGCAKDRPEVLRAGADYLINAEAAIAWIESVMESL